jgi:hypothetical protein
MVLRRWEPFRELRQMQEDMNRMWRNFGRGGGEEEVVENWAIPLDVVQQGDNIIVKASVPGVKPEGPNDEIAKSEGRGQHREKLARHFPCCHTCFSRIS